MTDNVKLTFNSLEQRAAFWQTVGREDPGSEPTKDDLRLFAERAPAEDDSPLRDLVERVRAHLIAPEGPIGSPGAGLAIAHHSAPGIIAGAAVEAPGWQHEKTEISRAWFDALAPGIDSGVAWLGETTRKVVLFEMDHPDSYGLLLLGSSAPGFSHDYDNELVFIPFKLDVAIGQDLRHIMESIQNVLSGQTTQLNLKTKELRVIIDHLRLPLADYVLTRGGSPSSNRNLRINQFQVERLSEEDGQPLYHWQFAGAEPDLYTRRWIQQLPDNDPQVIHVADKTTGEKIKVVWMESTNNPQKFCLFYLIGEWVHIIPLDKREHETFWTAIQNAMVNPRSVKEVPGFDDPKPKPYPLGVGFYVGRKLSSPKNNLAVQLIDHKLAVTYSGGKGSLAEKVEFAPSGLPEFLEVARTGADAPAEAAAAEPAKETERVILSPDWLNELDENTPGLFLVGDKRYFYFDVDDEHIILVTELPSAVILNKAKNPVGATGSFAGAQGDAKTGRLGVTLLGPNDKKWIDRIRNHNAPLPPLNLRGGEGELQANGGIRLAVFAVNGNPNRVRSWLFHPIEENQVKIGDKTADIVEEDDAIKLRLQPTPAELVLKFPRSATEEFVERLYRNTGLSHRAVFSFAAPKVKTRGVRTGEEATPASKGVKAVLLKGVEEGDYALLYEGNQGVTIVAILKGVSNTPQVMATIREALSNPEKKVKDPSWIQDLLRENMTVIVRKSSSAKGMDLEGSEDSYNVKTGVDGKHLVVSISRGGGAQKIECKFFLADDPFSPSGTPEPTAPPPARAGAYASPPIYSDLWFETLPDSDPHVFQYTDGRGGARKVVYLTDPSNPEDYALITKHDNGTLVFAPMKRVSLAIEEIFEEGERRVINDRGLSEAINGAVFYSLKEITNPSGVARELSGIVMKIYQERDQIAVNVFAGDELQKIFRFSPTPVPFAATQPSAPPADTTHARAPAPTFSEDWFALQEAGDPGVFERNGEKYFLFRHWSGRGFLLVMRDKEGGLHVGAFTAQSLDKLPQPLGGEFVKALFGLNNTYSIDIISPDDVPMDRIPPSYNLAKTSFREFIVREKGGEKKADVIIPFIKFDLKEELRVGGDFVRVTRDGMQTWDVSDPSARILCTLSELRVTTRGPSAGPAASAELLALFGATGEDVDIVDEKDVARERVEAAIREFQDVKRKPQTRIPLTIGRTQKTNQPFQTAAEPMPVTLNIISEAEDFRKWRTSGFKITDTIAIKWGRNGDAVIYALKSAAKNSFTLTPAGSDRVSTQPADVPGGDLKLTYYAEGTGVITLGFSDPGSSEIYQWLERAVNGPVLSVILSPPEADEESSGGIRGSQLDPSATPQDNKRVIKFHAEGDHEGELLARVWGVWEQYVIPAKAGIPQGHSGDPRFHGDDNPRKPTITNGAWSLHIPYPQTIAEAEEVARLIGETRRAYEESIVQKRTPSWISQAKIKAEAEARAKAQADEAGSRRQEAGETPGVIPATSEDRERESRVGEPEQRPEPEKSADGPTAGSPPPEVTHGGDDKSRGPRTETDTLADPATGGDVVMMEISKEIDADGRVTSVTIKELIIHGKTIPSDDITVTDEDVGAIREFPLPVIADFPFTLTVQRDVPEGVAQFEITINTVTGRGSRVTNSEIELSVSEPTTVKFTDIGEEISVRPSIQTGERSAIGDLFTLKIKRGEHPRTKQTIITGADLTLDTVAIDVLGFNPKSKSSVTSPNLPIVLGKDPVKITLNYPDIGDIEYTLAVRDSSELMAVRGPIKNKEADWKIEFRGKDQTPFLMGLAHDTAVIEFPLEKTAAVRGARRVLRETYFSVAGSHTGSLWLWSMLAGRPIDLNLGEHNAIRVEARRVRGPSGSLVFEVDRNSFHPYKKNPGGDDPVHVIHLSDAEYDLIRKHLGGLPAEGAVIDRPLELPERPIPVELPHVLPSEEISIAPGEVLLPTRETMDWIHERLGKKADGETIPFDHMAQIDRRLEFETGQGEVLSIPVHWVATRMVNNPFGIDTGYFEIDDAGGVALDDGKPKLKGTGRRIEVYQKGHPETRRMVDTDVRAVDMGGFWNIYGLVNNGEGKPIKAFNLKIVKARLEIDKESEGRVVYESPVLFALVNTLNEAGNEDDVRTIRKNARTALNERAHNYYDKGTLEEVAAIYLGKRKFSQSEGQPIELTYISENERGVEVARLEGIRLVGNRHEVRLDPLLTLHKGEETIRLRHRALEKQADIIRLTEVLPDGKSGRKFDWNVRRHVILERKSRSPGEIDSRKFLMALQRKGIPLTTRLLAPRGEAEERVVEYKEGATVQINAEVPELPGEHQGFALPANIESLTDERQIRELVSQLALHDEFFIPVERTVFEQSLIGGPAEVMTFIGRKSRIMIQIYMEYDEKSGRYFAHYEPDPPIPIRYARILIPDPNRRRENVYFDVRSGFHEKRMPGRYIDRVDLQIYYGQRGAIDLTLHRRRYDQTFSGREIFGFRAEVAGQEPGRDDSEFAATMKTWISLLGMHEGQTPDMLSHSVGEMTIGDSYDVRFGDRYELGLQVTRSADRAYTVDGIEIVTDSRLSAPVARILYVDAQDAEGSEKFFLVYRDGGLYYLNDPETGQYYNFILSSDGQLWVWKRRRNLRDFLEPPESVGYPMVKIKGDEYSAVRERRARGKKEIESKAVREIYEDVSDGWRAFEITAVLGRQQQVAEEAVRFGSGEDKLIRVRFVVKVDPDGGLHFEPGKFRDEDKDLEKTFLFGDDFKIEHSEDVWIDGSGKTYQGHLRIAFHREEVVVERRRKKKDGAPGEVETYRSELSPYGVMEFDTRENLIGNWEDFHITKAHAHETKGYTSKKLMPATPSPSPSTGDGVVSLSNQGDQVGFLTRRAGVLVDKTAFNEEMFTGPDAIENGARVLADLETTMARPKDVPILLGALVLFGKAKISEKAQTIIYEEEDLVNLAAFSALRNPAIKGGREEEIVDKKERGGGGRGGSPTSGGGVQGKTSLVTSRGSPFDSAQGRRVTSRGSPFDSFRSLRAGESPGHEEWHSTMARATEIARRSEGLSTIAGYLERLGHDRKQSLHNRALQKNDSLIQIYLKLIKYGNAKLMKTLKGLEGDLSVESRIILLAAGDMNKPEILIVAADRIIAGSSVESPNNIRPAFDPSHFGGQPAMPPAGTVVPVH